MIDTQLAVVQDTDEPKLLCHRTGKVKSIFFLVLPNHKLSGQMFETKNALCSMPECLSSSPNSISESSFLLIQTLGDKK